MEIVNRAGPGFVALETTLPLHGVPRQAGPGLCDRLREAVQKAGATAAFVGVVSGRGTVGLTPAELKALFEADDVPKANSANLGALAFRGSHAATTVSSTVELAAAAGIRVVATGGIGGVHRGYAMRLDVSADLAALARFPLAVVASGAKSLLDVESTREALEALGVPVVGFRCDRFPAFYLRESEAGLDARFDDERELAAFIDAEVCRTGRGIVVANPVPATAAIPPQTWATWLAAAQSAGSASGRDSTPALLSELHRVSGGRTLEANVALALDNAALAGRVCAALRPSAITRSAKAGAPLPGSAPADA